jgi:hypothetical protein
MFFRLLHEWARLLMISACLLQEQAYQFMIAARLLQEWAYQLMISERLLQEWAYQFMISVCLFRVSESISAWCNVFLPLSFRSSPLTL